MKFIRKDSKAVEAIQFTLDNIKEFKNFIKSSTNGQIKRIITSTHPKGSLTAYLSSGDRTLSITEGDYIIKESDGYLFSVSDLEFKTFYVPFKEADKNIKIEVKLLNKDAKLPEFKTKNSAGFDIYTTDDNTIISPGETAKIGTGLAFGIPTGYQIEIRNRSGMALKTKLRIANTPGTIDSDYRGEISLIVDNIGSEDILIEKGTRLAQGVLAKVIPSSFKAVEELDKTERGSGGFGHTGLK